jgi:hypothetical protein
MVDNLSLSNKDRLETALQKLVEERVAVETLDWETREKDWVGADPLKQMSKVLALMKEFGFVVSGCFSYELMNDFCNRLVGWRASFLDLISHSRHVMRNCSEKDERILSVTLKVFIVFEPCRSVVLSLQTRLG